MTTKKKDLRTILKIFPAQRIALSREKQKRSEELLENFEKQKEAIRSYNRARLSCMTFCLEIRGFMPKQELLDQLLAVKELSYKTIVISHAIEYEETWIYIRLTKKTRREPKYLIRILGLEAKKPLLFTTKGYKQSMLHVISSDVTHLCYNV